MLREENLVLAIQLLKWLSISLNTEKLRFAFADMADKIHPNTSHILIIGNISGSRDTKDFIKVSGRTPLPNCLDHILNHLYTSLSNDFGVGRSSCHHSSCSVGGIHSLTIKDGTRLSNAHTG